MLTVEQMALVEDGGEPVNVFRDPEKNQFLHIPVEYDLPDSARSRHLGSGQAPYSKLIDEVEEQWANAAASAG